MNIQAVRLVVLEAGGLPRHRFALVETSRLSDIENFDRLSRCVYFAEYSKLHQIEPITRT